MKLKLDENGHVIVQDGKPVYQDSDGKDVPFDVSRAMMKIKELNEENATRRKSNEALESQLKQFEGLDVEEARKALDTVKKLDESQLINADKVKELEGQLKEQLKEIFDRDKQQIVTKANAEREKLLSENESLQNDISTLMKRNNFAKSKWFTSVNGEPALTFLDPDLGMDIFGKYFKVEGKGADAKFTGYLKGEKIASQDPSRLAEPADFDEAIGLILDSFGPDRKNSLLRAAPGGPGAANNNSDFTADGQKIKITRTQMSDPSAYRRAREAAQKTGAQIVIVD